MAPAVPATLWKIREKSRAILIREEFLICDNSNDVIIILRDLYNCESRTSTEIHFHHYIMFITLSLIVN